MSSVQDTVAAIATPPGRGGIGVVRVSGKSALDICHSLTGISPKPNLAKYVSFKRRDNSLIDKGIVLYFKAPHSFTGEDIVEYHAHGSDVVLESLLEEIFFLGARPARPGEFTERAFLNDKIDLIQAEAIADLINSKSTKAARSAMRSLSGEFSRKIERLSRKIIEAKALLEASLDFPDEEDIEIDVAPIINDLTETIATINILLKQAEAGEVLDRNLKLVIAGRPNVGKSSLLNYLSGHDAAIVSSVPGTTRDLVSHCISLNGIAMTLVDTAGVRETSDEIEQEGVSRSYKALKTADLVLYVVDNDEDVIELDEHIPEGTRKLIIRNKIDLSEHKPVSAGKDRIAVSTKTGEGIQELINALNSFLKVTDNDENIIFARKRHIEALRLSKEQLEESVALLEHDKAPELVAELLRKVLGLFDELTGKTTSDDILGEIFSRFCIGK